MMYLVKLQFDPDELLQAFADSQGIPLEQCDLSVEEILEQELGWLDASRVAVLDLEEENNNQISIYWHIEDVQSVAQEKFGKNLSNEDAFKVLEFAVHTHDACIGINWDVIYCAIETLKQFNEITLLEK